MSSVSKGVPFDAEEYISLYDIWQKIVLYKKAYWLVFFAMLTVGVGMVLLSPVKYEFTQRFKIGKYIGDIDKYEEIQLKGSKDLIANVKLIYVIEAFRKYNSQLVKKINSKDYKIEVKDAGDGAFILSAVDADKNAGIYNFIFKEIVNLIHNDIYEDIEFRVANLTALKKNLETRLHDLNFLYAETLKGKGSYVTGKPGATAKTDINSLDGKIISMYLNDQQAVIVNLTNNLNMVQTQIDSAYSVKTMADFMVSEFPVGPSKLALLILAIIAAFLFALFGVFIVDFVAKLKRLR